MKILSKIKSFLFKNEIEQIKNLEESLNKQIHNVEILEDNLNIYINRMKNILKHIEVDVAVNPRLDKSWAIISIANDKEKYLKFVDLRHQDCVTIFNFLKNFEYKNIDIDTEFYARKFFDNNLKHIDY
jgi:hypothetical protein